MQDGPGQQDLDESTLESIAKARAIRAAFAFVVAYTVYIGFLGVTWEWLPLRVASHFDLAGRPNGWMDRAQYGFYIAGTPCVLAILFCATALLTRRLPACCTGLPYREYWMVPERQGLATSILTERMGWLASLNVGFFAGLHGLIIFANRVEPPHLAGGLLMALIVIFLGAVGFWAVALYRRLAPGQGPNPGCSGSSHLLQISGDRARAPGHRKPFQ